MALAKTSYSVCLDTKSQNASLQYHLLQGTSDSEFIVTLLKDGVEQNIEDTAKVTLIILYGVTTTTGCGGTTVVTSKGSYVLQPNDPDYAITINNSKITVPVTEMVTNSSGQNQMILKLVDGSTAYTYTMLFYVDVNPAFQPQSTPDNLPTYQQLKAEISAINTQVTTNKNNIQTNTNNIATNTSQISTIKTDIANMKTKDAGHDADIAKVKSDLATTDAKVATLQTSTQTNTQDIAALKTADQTINGTLNQHLSLINQKANADLSNVGEFTTAANGSILYKKDNILKAAPLKVDDTNKLITTPYTIKVPPNTIRLGENIGLHENGGFVEYDTQSLGKNYILLGYENNPNTGSVKPVYYERGSKNTKVELQPVSNAVTPNVSTINIGRPARDYQVTAIYFNFINIVTNFTVKVNINGKDVGYYPSIDAWNANTPTEKALNPGYNLGIGLQKIDLKPYWTSLTDYTIILSIKADAPISMLGTGTVPYLAADINYITRKPIALMEDVGAKTSNGISITNDDTQPVNQTTVAYFPQARIEDGSTSGSKVIKTSIPYVCGTNTFDDYNKIEVASNYLSVNRKAGETDTLQIDFNGISVENGTVETPAIEVINFDIDDFNVASTENHIADIALKNPLYNGFLAIYSHRQPLAPKVPVDGYRVTNIAPNEVVLRDSGIQYVKEAGKFVLSPKKAGETTYFKICVTLSVRKEFRDDNLNTYIYLWDLDTNDYFLDSSGTNPLFNVLIDKSQPYGTVELISVIEVSQDKNLAIMFKDDHPGEYVDILDINQGISAVAIERVTVDNAASLAILYYENLTNERLRIGRLSFNDNFTDTSTIARTAQARGDAATNTTYVEDGWYAHYMTEGQFGIDNSNIVIMGTGTSPAFFWFGKILDYDETWALRGKDVRLTINRKFQKGEFILQAAVWKGQYDRFTSGIFATMDDQGVYTAETGWTITDDAKVTVVEPDPMATEQELTLNYTVPNDAVNIAFFVRPSKKTDLIQMDFSLAKLGVDTPFTKWIVNGSSLVNEGELQKNNKYIRFETHRKNNNNMSDWYLLPNNPTDPFKNYAAMYIGEPVAGANADVERVYDPTSTDYNELHNKGRLKFKKDGRVSVRIETSIGVPPQYIPADGHATINYWFIKDTGDHNIYNGNPIASSIHVNSSITRSGNVWTDGVRSQYQSVWTFSMDVKANEEYWVAAEILGLTNNGHAYGFPNGFIEINFLENEYVMSQMQSEIDSLKNIIKATQDAITNKAYIELGWDANNNKPSLEAKTDTTP